MSEHWLHYGSSADPAHCAECGCDITPASVLSTGATILTGTFTASIKGPPAPVGYWRFSGNYRWYSIKRPRWLTRVMMKFLLEWEWQDEPTSDPQPKT